MPTYCYTNKATGKTVERSFPCGKAPQTIRAKVSDDVLRVFHRDMAAEHGGAKFGPSGRWPILSDALAVHPDEIKDAKAYAASRGVKVEFAPGGECILESRAHRKDVCGAFDVFDKDAGYGDRAPTGNKETQSWRRGR